MSSNDETTDISKRERIVNVMQAIGFVAALVVLGVAAWWFGWGDYLIGEEGISRLQQIVDENLAVLAIPGFLFAIAAGVLFGPILGTICYVVGATIAAVIAFFAGRTFLTGFIKPIAMRNKYLKRWLYDEVQRDAIIVLLITRTFPVIPYNVQNFAYGTTDIDPWTYTWGTALFAIPGTAVYTFAAAGAIDESQRVLYMVIAAVLLIILFVVLFILNRKYDILKR